MPRPFHRPLALLLALPPWLGGCLLPQPDTPPIPPFMQGAATSGRNAAPAKATSPVAPSEAPSPSADATRATTPPAADPMASPTGDQGMASNGGALLPTNGAGGTNAAGTTEMAAPGQLRLRFQGAKVAQVWAFPAGGGDGVGMDVQDGAAALELPAGEYFLELVVDGASRRTTKPVAVPAGGARELTVDVEGDGVTITEAVALADPRPTPAPSSSPDTPEPAATP